MRHKRDIDRTLAILLGEEQNKVSLITKAFLHEVMRLIIEERSVHIDGFGRFTLRVKTGWNNPIELTTGTFKKNESGAKKRLVAHCRPTVYFSKAPTFRAMTRERFNSPEDDMDKYAVDENVDQEQLEKASAQGCPECGEKVERHGSVLRCPVHGTEPFERGKKA